MATKDNNNSFLSHMNGIDSNWLKGKSEQDEEFSDTYTRGSPKRRRKVDNEGFVRPTTPDIPKTSPYYQYNTSNSAYTMSSVESDESFDQNFTSSFHFDKNTASSSDFQVLDPSESYDGSHLSETPKDQSCEVSQTPDDQSYAESYFSQSLNDQLNAASEQSQTPDTLSTETTPEDAIAKKDSPGSAQNIYDDMNIADIITDMKEKTAKVYMHWLELFRDGEKFEEEVPSLIDDLLNQAKQTEQHLVEQKESLRQRIYGITQTLRIDNL